MRQKHRIPKHECHYEAAINGMACLQAILTKGASLDHVRFLALAGLIGCNQAMAGKKISVEEAQELAHVELEHKFRPELHPDLEALASGEKPKPQGPG